MNVQVLQNLITKPKITPAVPMRALFWSIISTSQLNKSVWKSLDDSKIKLNIDELIKCFAQKKSAEKSSSEESKSQEEVKKIEKISFLTKERTQGVGIILGKLRLSNSAIIEGLLSCDLVLLQEGSLNSLRAALPDDAEYGVVGNYEGDIELLAVPDRFFYSLIKEVPAYKFRVEGMLFTFSHKEIIGSLKSKVEMIETTIEQLKSNKRLMVVLETILAAGNYLNGTSARGGAFGFTVDSLSKVIDMRGQDGKTTLLDYLIMFFDATQKDILNLKQDFNDIDLVSKMPLSQLTIELNEATVKFNCIRKAIESQSIRAVDKIKEKLSPAYELIQIIIDELKQRIQGIDTRYLDLCEHYCANPKDNKFEEFCEKFYIFIKAFDDNKTKYLALREENEKKERIEARKKANAANKPVQAISGVSAIANAKSLADSLRARKLAKDTNEKATPQLSNVKNSEKMLQEIETRKLTVMGKD